MALVLKDRVRETTTTTGTGNYVLAGAVTGYESFAGIGDGNTTYYACTNGTDWEVGIGTYTASGTILARTTILESSNADSAVSWAAGSKTIFVTQPSEKAVYLDASGNSNIASSNLTDGSSLLKNVVEDTTPQLGGNLDLNSNNITGTGNIDVTGNATANSFIIDTGTSDWKVEVVSNELVISYGGVGKMKLDSSGNLTVTGDVVSEGTI